MTLDFSKVAGNPTIDLQLNARLDAPGLTFSAYTTGANGYDAFGSGFENFNGGTGINIADFSNVVVATNSSITATMGENLLVTLGATETAVFSTGFGTNHANATVVLSDFQSFVGNNGIDTWKLTNSTGAVTIVSELASTNILDASAVTTNAVIDLKDGGFEIGASVALSDFIHGGAPAPPANHGAEPQPSQNLLGAFDVVTTGGGTGTTYLEFGGDAATVIGGGGTAILYGFYGPPNDGGFNIDHGTLIGAAAADRYSGSNGTDDFYFNYNTNGLTGTIIGGNPTSGLYADLNLQGAPNGFTVFMPTNTPTGQLALGSVSFTGFNGTDYFANIETIFGGNGTDILHAGTDTITFIGNNGTDIIYPGAGTGLFEGGTSVNTFMLTNASTGNATLMAGSSGDDVLNGSGVTGSLVVDLYDDLVSVNNSEVGPTLDTSMGAFSVVVAAGTGTNTGALTQVYFGDDQTTTVNGGAGTATLFDSDDNLVATLIGTHVADVFSSYSYEDLPDDNNSFYFYSGGAATAIASNGVDFNFVYDDYNALYLAGITAAATINMATGTSGLSTVVSGGVTDVFTNIPYIVGGNGADTFYAGTDPVTFIGGNGADTFYAGNVSNFALPYYYYYDEYFQGGSAQLNAANFVNVTTPVEFDLYSASVGVNTFAYYGVGGAISAFLSTIETITGSPGNDLFYGSLGLLSEVTIYGGGGVDTLSLYDYDDGTSFTNASFVNVHNFTVLRIEGEYSTVTATNGFEFSVIDLTDARSYSVNLAGDTAAVTVVLSQYSDDALTFNTRGNDVVAFPYYSGTLALGSTVEALINSYTDNLVGVTTFLGNGNDDAVSVASVASGTISVNLSTGLAVGSGTTYSLSGFDELQVEATQVNSGNTFIGNNADDTLTLLDAGQVVSDLKIGHITGFPVLNIEGLSGDTDDYVALGNNSVLNGVREVTIGDSPYAQVYVDAKSLVTPIDVIVYDTQSVVYVGGGASNDYIDISSANYGGANGGQGDDTIVVNPNRQDADGGGGNDTLVVPESFSGEIETVVLGTADGSYSPVVVGAAYTQSFFQNFVLTPSTGYGGGDPDLTVYAYNNLSHTIITGGGNDTLFGGNVSNYLDGGTGNNTLAGGSGVNVFIGNAGSTDVLMGMSSGSNTLELAGTVADDFIVQSTSSKGGPGYYNIVENFLYADISAGSSGNGILDYAVSMNSGMQTVDGVCVSYDLSSIPTVAFDLSLSDDATHDIQLGTAGGFVYIPVNTGNVTLAGGSDANPLTVDLSINSAAHISLTGGGSNNMLILTGVDKTAGQAGSFGNLSETGFSNIDASGVYVTKAGSGLLLGVDAGTPTNIEAAYASRTATTLIGSQGSDVLVGGGADDLLTSTSGHDTMIGDGGNDTFVLQSGPVGHSDVIDVVGGLSWDPGSLASTSFVSVRDTSATIDLSNFGDVGMAVTGFARGTTGDLIAYMSQAAGGGTIDVKGYYNQTTTALNPAVTLIGQDTVGNGGGQATFVLGTTAGSAGTKSIDGDDYLLVGFSGATLTAYSNGGSTFYYGGGSGATAEKFTDASGEGSANFALASLATGTGILVDMTNAAASTTSDLVYQITGGESAALSSLLTYISGEDPNLSTAAASLLGIENALGTSNKLATMSGFTAVEGTPNNDVFIGPATGDDNSSVGFQGNGGNDTYININPASVQLEVSYANAPLMTLKDTNGNVEFQGGVVVNLDVISHSFGALGSLSIASDRAYDGWGGTDTLIGINQIQGTSNNDLVWGGPQGIQFQGNGGNDTLIGSALAIDANFENTIDYSEDPGRALGGVTDTTYAGVRVNLSDSDIHLYADLERRHRHRISGGRNRL